MNIRLSERELKTKFGVFREILYYDGQKESIALVAGNLKDRKNVFCRIHSNCISAHVFNSIECECREEMEVSQKIIQQSGEGVIIWLDQEGKGNGHLALLESIPYKQAGLNQSEAYQKAGFAADARSFRPAAEILADLQIRSVILLTNNPDKALELEKYSIPVAATKAVSTP